MKTILQYINLKSTHVNSFVHTNASSYSTDIDADDNLMTDNVDNHDDISVDIDK